MSLKNKKLIIGLTGGIAAYKTPYLIRLLKHKTGSNDFLFDSDETDPKIVLGSKKTTILGDSTLQAAREGAGVSVEKG